MSDEDAVVSIKEDQENMCMKVALSTSCYNIHAHMSKILSPMSHDDML